MYNYLITNYLQGVILDFENKKADWTWRSVGFFPIYTEGS